MGKEYPNEFKIRVIKRYERGESIQDLSKELSVAESTLYRWRDQYCTIKAGERTYTPKEFDKISKRLQHLEREMEIIKFSGYLSKEPLQERLATLEGLYHQFGNAYSVRELCEALQVDRGTFYNHIFRRADRSQREKEQNELMRQVRQIFDDSQQRFGAEKIRQILVQNDIHVSRKRISAIMQELKLQSVRTDAKKQYKRQQQHRKENILSREFTVTRPDQVWVSDITNIKVQGYWVYLCVILDLFARKIVGFRVSRNASTHLVSATFRAAFEERGRPTELMFHSDRGAQYTAASFSKLLRECNVKQSFSGIGQPLDNAVAETFFATFKKEEAYRREYTSEQHFRKSTKQYIHFYNQSRPHQTLKYKTPQVFEDLYREKHMGNPCRNQGTA